MYVFKTLRLFPRVCGRFTPDGDIRFVTPNNNHLLLNENGGSKVNLLCDVDLYCNRVDKINYW